LDYPKLHPIYLLSVPTEDHFLLHDLSQSCSDWPGRKESKGITAFKTCWWESASPGQSFPFFSNSSRCLYDQEVLVTFCYLSFIQKYT